MKLRQLALAATVISGFDYFFGLRKRIDEQRAKEKSLVDSDPA